ncbi:hypothetical protein ACMC5R_09170 [Deferribacteres bacterium DY0037]
MAFIYESFKDIEHASIYWMGGFSTDEKKNWCVNVYLNYENRVWYYKIPVGFLISMFIGAEFRYGKFVKKKFISNGKLTCFDISKIEFVPFADMPSELYSDHFNPALKDELVCKYAFKGSTFYIPQMEIIRAFFGINTTTTHSLLMPSGLNDLFRVKQQGDNFAEIVFDRDFPKKNVSQSLATYFTSMLFDSQLYDMWSSVYHSAKVLRDKRLFIPVNLQVSIDFKCSKYGDNYLIKKVNKINNLPCPFEYVLYSHPFVKDESEERGGEDQDNANTDRKSGRPRKNAEGDGETNEDAYSSYDVNRPVKNPPGSSVHFSFRKPVKAIVRYDEQKGKPKRHNDKEKSETSTVVQSEPKSNKKYSAGKSIGVKSEKPIELKSYVSSNDINWQYGELSFFAEAVELLGVDQSAIKIGRLHGHTKFVLIDEYTRREYAVVEFSGVLILEFARPDKHPISTLILKIDKNNTIHQILRVLLKSVVGNNGHWDKKWLREKYELAYVKHLQDDTAENYVERLRKAIDSI